MQNGAVATGDVYPQPQATGVLWDAYLIKHTNKELCENELFYFAACLQKSIKLKYGYDKKATWDRIKKDNITIPILNGDIDYDLISTFINAIKKEVIKDLVTWKDRELAATRLATSEKDTSSKINLKFVIIKKNN